MIGQHFFPVSEGRKDNLGESQRPFRSKITENGEMDVNRDRNWNHQEIVKLTIFLKQHLDAFQNYKAKRSIKVYKVLSAFMQTRNANQCRTYMQKMIKKFGNVEQALLFLNQITVPDLDDHLRKKEEISEEIVKQQLTYQQILSERKENKISFIEDEKEQGPTGIDYLPEEINHLQKRQYRKSFFQDDSFQNIYQFDALAQHQNRSFLEATYIFKDQNYPFFSMKKTEQYSGQSEKQNSDKLWADCHESFLQWVDALKKLLEKRQNKGHQASL